MKQLISFLKTASNMNSLVAIDREYVPTIIEALEKQATSNYTSEWIPVSERLPETEEMVLVTVSGTHGSIIFESAIQMGCYDEESGWYICEFMDWRNPKVTAWTPLPEPYIEE